MFDLKEHIEGNVFLDLLFAELKDSNNCLDHVTVFLCKKTLMKYLN